MGMVLVTQHIEEIMPVFENVLVLCDGRIIEKGPTERVISSQLIHRLYGVSAKIMRSAARYWMIRD
jgi:iron complex transport system ATP-binding protein